MTMTTSREDGSHEVLATFLWAHSETDSVYHRVEAYDPAAGTLRLGDEDGHGGFTTWQYDGTQWVCQDSHHEAPGDLTETEFTGAAHCNECARPFQATHPTEDYCGCRH